MDYFGGSTRPVYNPAATTISAPIASNDPKYAEKTYAQLTRDGWADYLKRFVPIEDAMIQSYQDPAKMAANVDTAKNLSNTAFNVASGVDQRNAARYGVNLGVNKSYQRNMALGATAAQVGAANMARATTNENNKKLLEGGVTMAG